MEQKQSKTNVREMALIALMAAVTCILGPLSVPIGVVPISLTNFAIYLAIYVLGCRRGTISYIVYLLLFTSMWNLNWALDKNEGLQLSEFGRAED